MKTIDNIDFPPSGAGAQRMTLPWPVRLPNGTLLPSGCAVWVRHDGVWAFIRRDGEDKEMRF